MPEVPGAFNLDRMPAAGADGQSLAQEAGALVWEWPGKYKIAQFKPTSGGEEFQVPIGSRLILVDAVDFAGTVVLPDVEASLGLEYVTKKIDSTANVVTIKGGT